MIAGIPNAAEIRKKSWYPNSFTTKPEDPPKILGGTETNKNSKAYWVAVKLTETILDNKVIVTVPTYPWVKLSSPIVTHKKGRSFVGSRSEPR